MEKKRGRPKKPKRERRSNMFRIMLTIDDRKVIDAAAAAKSMESSTWARMILLSVARGGTEKPAQSD